MDKIILCKTTPKSIKLNKYIHFQLLKLHTHIRFYDSWFYVLSSSFIAELSATSAGRKPSLSAIEQSAPDCNSSFTIDIKSQVAAVIWNKRNERVSNIFGLDTTITMCTCTTTRTHYIHQNTSHDQTQALDIEKENIYSNATYKICSSQGRE